LAKDVNSVQYNFVVIALFPFLCGPENQNVTPSTTFFFWLKHPPQLLMMLRSCMKSKQSLTGPIQIQGVLKSVHLLWYHV